MSTTTTTSNDNDALRAQRLEIIRQAHQRVEAKKMAQQKPKRKQFTAEDVAEWRRLIREEGRSNGWIAGQVGVTSTTVAAWLKRFPEEAHFPEEAREPTGEPAALAVRPPDNTPPRQLQVNGFLDDITAFKRELEAAGVEVAISMHLRLIKEIRLD